MSMFVGAGRRGGTRGGADQFTWEDVKNDKYKEFYLGHSLVTSSKPTFNNRKPNPLWWGSKDKNQPQSDRKAELEEIKRQEEQLMKEALGLVPKSRASGRGLDPSEMQDLLKRGQSDNDAYDADRISGVGFGSHKTHEVNQKERLLERVVNMSKSQNDENNIDNERSTKDTREDREWEVKDSNEDDKKSKKRKRKEKKKEKKT
eukprot:TRINITY_DN1286_c0_g1_i2.p1 TRINITY_DN1286_c0_g1~~TRINITY_DN1286_c0_g1_i2.p1  ORF type:complete len:203 (+),score=56.06 TRINITY_DN1286_c0_g1_i2:101-709(+)